MSELAAGAVASLEPAAALSALDSLPVGARAVIGRPLRVTPTVLRLLEMGLTPQALVAVTRRSAGGDPLEIRVRGTRLCLRRADAARFPIRRLIDPSADPA